MNPATWDIDEPEVQPGGEQPQSTLVSLHFIRSALRRRRRATVVGAVLGLLAAIAFLLVFPASQQAETTLVMSHDPTADSEGAMATDVALASTRDVAQQTIAQLRLRMSAQELLTTVTVDPTTSSIMTISLKAATAKEAQNRLATLTSAFLGFRSRQLSAQSDALVAGLNDRVASLQEQVKNLTSQIDVLASRSDVSSASQLNEAVSQRAQLGSQIATIQESVQDAKVQTASVIASSRVIDAPHALPDTALKRAILLVMAGLILGTGLSAGITLLMAITSDRIRLRAEVATVFEVPVIASVRAIAPIPAWMRRLPVLRTADARRTHDRQRAANAIMSAIPASGAGQWLAVGCVDNSTEVVYGVAEAAMTLQRRGQTIRLIDLTESGRLHAAAEALQPYHGLRVPVLRPKGIPSLASDIGEIEIYGPRTTEIPALRETDIFLSVSDLHPSFGAAHLAAWTQRVLVCVTSGRASAERLRTAADMLAAARLTLWCAVLLGTEGTDSSSGAFRGAGIQAAAEQP